MVFASSFELVEDVRKAPEDVLCTKAPGIEVHILLWMIDLYS